jgi:hypothetical protein
MTKLANLARRSHLSIPLIGMGLSLSTAAVAQQPTQAQISAIRSSCQSDYRAHCAGVPTGGAAALACLRKNVASLSQACQTAVNAAGAGPSAAPAAPAASPAAAPSAPGASPAAAPVAPPASPTAPAVSATPAAPAQSYPPMTLRQELAILRRYCGPDYRALCGGVQPGGGRAIACLRENGASLSPGCRRVLMRASRR